MQRSPGQYKISAHDAYEKLVSADFRDFMRNRQCGILIHVSSDGEQDKPVTWHITSSDRNMFLFTANLVPVDATRTKIEIDVSKEIKNGREAYDGTQQCARPAVMQPVRPAIEEQIDAILTGRPFKWENTRKASATQGPPGTFAVMSNDSVCNVQRGGLEEFGEPFSIDDVEENLMN